jgi:hypothetical protein
MSDNFFESVPISEDDIIINLRFNVVFCENQPSLSFQEEWIIDPIKKHFKNYNFNNAIRMNAIEIVNNQTLLFDFKQINPDFSLEEIVEGINSNLEEIFRTFNIGMTDNFWKSVEIYSIGDKDDAIAEANEYLKRLKKGTKKGKNKT